MKDIKRCCFAGHNDMLDEGAKQKIKIASENLIVNHNVKEFWVGNYGTFDRCVSSAIRELKKIYSDIKLYLVIPYLTKSINDYKDFYYEKYDGILMADIPQSTPKKFHITKANEYIVNNSDFLICHIERSWGGAFTTYKFAKSKKLEIFNVAQKPIE